MNHALSWGRLLRLASPTLPIGAFGYSQGLEWAVESGGVGDEARARLWIGGLLRGPMARFELPMLASMMAAWTASELHEITRLNEEFLAAREARELRAESVHMGQALVKALRAAGDVAEHGLAHLEGLPAISYPAAFACALADWKLTAEEGVTAYLWAWLENQVMAAIKLVPLGQNAGQRLLAAFTAEMPAVVEGALAHREQDFSNFAPMLAIASSRHETQYTRLFRS